MSGLTRFNSLFDDTFFNDFFRPVRRGDSADKVPAIDVHEGDGQYLIKVDLPGVSKDDIKIAVDNGVLSITAETRSEDKEEQDGKLIRQERHFGKFVRSLSIGADVDPAQISARFDQGVLSLFLPKREEAAKEQMTIDID